MTKVGDKVVMEDGQEGTVVHVTPSINESCDHDWVEDSDGNPEHCAKCGLSFTRYIFCCFP